MRFDLLYLDDEDLRERPLIERKEMLEKILPKDPLLQYSTHVWDKGIAAFKRAARAGEEGVMAKLATSHYYSGQRTRDWLKVKASLGQEVVIVGFTAPRRSRQYFGSLLLAVRDGKRWRYVGRAGTGFDRRVAQIAARAARAARSQTQGPSPRRFPTQQTPPGSSRSSSAK